MLRLLDKSKNNVQYYDLKGTIDDVAFNDFNVVKGSLNVTNQMSGSSTFTLGGGFIGQLTVTFIQLGINIPRNSWVGRKITLSVFINDDTEEIPIGVFTIAAAKHSGGLVQIVAYDDMQKLDISNTLALSTTGTAYDFLTMICSECGVTLGQTKAEIESLTNGKIPLSLFSMGDIETFRDLAYWLAVTLCGFVTIDRYGKLVIKSLHGTEDDTIDSTVRYSISNYGDEQIFYTAATVSIEETGEIETYGIETVRGYTLDTGNNPFMQGPEAQRKDLMENILQALANVHYNSCVVAIPFGCHYDLGDVLKFPGGNGSNDNLFCICAYSFNYYGKYSLSSIPNNQSGKSKTDKSVQSLINTSAQKEFNSYEAKNLQSLEIDSTKTQILQCRIASAKKTKAEIHIEILLESTSDTQSDFTTANVYYSIDSEEQNRRPVEMYTDGKHIMHLMYILELQANTQKTFAISIEAENGIIKINQSDAWLYASGASLAGEGKNDGNIKVSEKVFDFELSDMTFENAIDNVDVLAEGTARIVHSEEAPAFELFDVIFEEAEDNVYVISQSNRRRMTENGLVRKTEDGRIRYTEGE